MIHSSLDLRSEAMARQHKRKRADAKHNSSANSRGIRVLRVNKGDDLKTLYGKVRNAFTASDLQRYTQDEATIPAMELVEQLKTMELQARKRKKTRAAP